MCRYWKKQYTCGCLSHLYRDRCTTCLHASSADECDNMETEETPRKSYFMCYPCLVQEDRREKQQAQQAVTSALERSKQEAELRKKEAEKQRQIQASRDLQLKAEREKEEELRRQRDLKAEQERKRREGASFVDVGSTRNRRRRNGGNTQNTLPARLSQAPPPLTPGLFAPLNEHRPTSGGNGTTLTLSGLNIAANSKNGTTLNNTGANQPLSSINSTGIKENMDSSATNGNTRSPSKNTGVDPGGRAGRWGPSGRK